MEVSTWGGLDTALKKTLIIAIKKVGELVAVKLYQNTENKLYTTTESDYYTRTQQYLESITVSNIKQFGNDVEIKIFHDPTKIFPRNVGNTQFFNEHMSLNGADSYGGKTISEWLVTWLEVGQDSILNPEPGHWIVKTTYDQLIKSDFVRKEMMKELRRMGFICK